MEEPAETKTVYQVQANTLAQGNAMGNVKRHAGVNIAGDMAGFGNGVNKEAEEFIARTFHPGEWSRNRSKGSTAPRHEFPKAPALAGYRDPAFVYRGGNSGNRRDGLHRGQRERRGILAVALLVVQACKQSGWRPLPVGVVASLGIAGLGVKHEVGWHSSN